MKKFLIVLILAGYAINVSAFTFLDQNAFTPQPNNLTRFISKIWECTWRISCYNKLGAFTTLNSTDNISSFPTTYNANLDKTIEVGTTSIPTITTLSGLTTASALATVGTITSGTWQGSVIDVARQGTGTTSPSIYQVILGNGANGLTVASSTGVSGQFLQSQGPGAYPSWQTSAVDQAATYSWTGIHDFVKATTTNATSTNLNVSNIASTSQLRAQSIGVGISTSTQKNVEIAGDLQVTGTSTISGGCNGCGIVPVYFSVGSTNFVQAGADGYIGLATSSAAAQKVHYNSPVSGIMKNFYVVCAGTGAGATVNFKVQINGTPSAIATGNVVCTSGAEGSDTTNQIAIAKGDDIEVFADFQSGGQLLQMQGSAVIIAAKF